MIPSYHKDGGHKKLLVKNVTYHWLVKFHTLMDREIVSRYRTLSGEYFQVVDDLNILPCMQAADILATGLLGCLYSQTYLFQASETLTYTTGFHLFSADTSTLRIMEQEGEGTMHVVLRIRTSNFLDHFYRVRDRVNL